MHSPYACTSAYSAHRCADLSPAYRNKRRFSHIIAIIPGPKEPSNIAPYLQKTLDAFRKYGPEGMCRLHWLVHYCLMPLMRQCAQVKSAVRCVFSTCISQIAIYNSTIQSYLLIWAVSRYLLMLLLLFHGDPR